MTTEPDKPEAPWCHIAFRFPIRVLLQGKSTAVYAVNAQVIENHDQDAIRIRTRHLYSPTNAGASATATTGTGELTIPRDNIASILTLRELPK